MSNSKKRAVPKKMSEKVIEYKIHDLVWSKMKGFHPWPSMVVEPSYEMRQIRHKESALCCYFFGSHNFAWMDPSYMKPYGCYWKKKYTEGNDKPTSEFFLAIREIEEHVKELRRLKRRNRAAIAKKQK